MACVRLGLVAVVSAGLGLAGCASSATRGVGLYGDVPEMGAVGAPRSTSSGYASWDEPSSGATYASESTLPVFMPGTVRRDRSLQGEVVPTGWTPSYRTPSYDYEPSWVPAAGGHISTAPC